MTIPGLIIREILYRKLNFALSVLSVLVAAGCLVAVVTLLRGYDLRTGAIIETKITETEAKVRERQAEAGSRADELNEAYRKIMLEFGYSLLILPKEEKLLDYELGESPSKHMPEESVKLLSNSGIMTVRHLLPVLQQKQIMVFGDKRREVMLTGVRGEVPLSHRAAKKPLLALVPPGEMAVGHNVHRELNLKIGDRVKVIDRNFKVTRIYDPRGGRDDSSVWIDLKTAQELLGKEGRISGIFALNCLCTRAGIDAVTEDIRRILPGTQIRVKMTDAVVRYESRLRAARDAKTLVVVARRQGRADIERERRARAELKGQMAAFGAWIVPLIILGAAAWIGLLAFSNARERRGEIGVLRAIGLRSRQIFSVFLAKAMLTGVAGACIGYAAGFFTALAWGHAPPAAQLFDPLLAVLVLVLSPVLACLASWLPAMLAAREDPATVLAEE